MIDNIFEKETWGTYEIDQNGELCIRRSEINYLMCYDHEFSDNHNYLELYLLLELHLICLLEPFNQKT